MKLHPAFFLSFAMLTGCSSNLSLDNPNLYSNLSGGQALGDATSIYWLTQKQLKPYTSADHVSMGDYGWYESDYRWEEGDLRELIREGAQRNNQNELVPYRVHVRFNQDGEAIYQQYRLDGKIYPLKAEQIGHYQSEAHQLVDRVKEQNRKNLVLIQGVWDGEKLQTCDGKAYSQLEFNESLPEYVVNRLAAVDSYIVVLGRASRHIVTVNQLLTLAEDDADCIERPSFIEN